MAPGLREQLKDLVYTKSSISVKELEGYLLDLFKSAKADDVVFSQWCKTRGIINRRQSALNLCDDPTCASCSALADAMKDALIKYGDSLTDEKNKT